MAEPKKKETPETLEQALVNVQGNLPTIVKNKKANYGTYADLDSIHEKVLPLLSQNGLVWITMPGIEDGEPVLRYELRHVSGGNITGTMRLYNQATPQGQGSGITYARRYALCAVIGITADDDDDGNHAEATHTATTPAAPKAITIRDPEAKMTDGQKMMIEMNLKQKHVVSTEDKTILMKMVIGRAGTPNKGEASQLIDYLTKHKEDAIRTDMIDYIANHPEEGLNGQD